MDKKKETTRHSVKNGKVFRMQVILLLISKTKPVIKVRLYKKNTTEFDGGVLSMLVCVFEERVSSVTVFVLLSFNLITICLIFFFINYQEKKSIDYDVNYRTKSIQNYKSNHAKTAIDYINHAIDRVV